MEALGLSGQVGARDLHLRSRRYAVALRQTGALRQQVPQRLQLDRLRLHGGAGLQQNPGVRQASAAQHNLLREPLVRPEQNDASPVRQRYSELPATPQLTHVATMTSLPTAVHLPVVQFAFSS